MTNEQLLSILLGALVAIGGALYTTLNSKLSKAEETANKNGADLAAFKEEIAKQYASREDVRLLQTEIKGYFENMNEKLDGIKEGLKSRDENFRDRLDRKQDRI